MPKKYKPNYITAKQLMEQHNFINIQEKISKISQDWVNEIKQFKEQQLKHAEAIKALSSSILGLGMILEMVHKANECYYKKIIALLVGEEEELEEVDEDIIEIKTESDSDSDGNQIAIGNNIKQKVKVK